ncbi:MAG: choice-of-anchor D domain-containing protein [Aquimonas sp.]|nr:choice-of-anchor D domain-containing protein [Aquimonas sp.]
MIGLHSHARRYLVAAALLLISSLSWAAAQKGLDQLGEGEWASVQAQIVAHRHRAEGDPVDGFRAHNGALGLAQRYYPDGRTQVEGQRLGVSLQLMAYGYGQLVQAGTPSLRAETDGQGAVVHYQWDENLREWWLNRPGSLEQWFELQRRPAEPDGGPLQLQMALEVPPNTPVHLDATGQALRIGEGEGALRYAGLKVWDTDGQILPARMQLNRAGDLLLSIDDALARYPVTIDPAWSQEVYFKASNAEAGDRFGYSIALSGSLSGDTLVVGAPSEDGGFQGSNSSQQSGAAYVFVRFAGNQWLQQAYLKASNIGAGDRFGHSVAVSGDTLVVGAPGERSQATGVNGNQLDDSAIDSGAAYVFLRVGGIGGTWNQQAYLKASNTDRFDRFGHAVAVSGDRVVVGAPRESSSATGVNGNQSNNDAEDSGAAYLFERNQANGSWSQLAYLKASNTGAGDQFGHAVAINGTTVVVGAPEEDSANDGAGNSGAVYVFQREGISVGGWFQQRYLKASNAGAGDLFGYSLALSGETLVVGAQGEGSNATGVNGDQTDNSAANSGAAYVFVRTGGRNGSWSQQAYLKASNTGAGDAFGFSVGLSGNLLVVGAIGEDSNARGIDGNQANNSIGGSGAAYAFVRSGTTWRPQAYIKASNTDLGNFDFGHSLAVWGSRLVVGKPGEGSPGIGINAIQGPPDGAPGSGAAYGFLLVPTLGGSVAGLAAGGSLTLGNSDGHTRVITGNGPFSFGAVAFDSPYDVRVIAQPTGQVCTVANGSGNALGEVIDIQVNCAVGTFTISGTLAGLNAGLSVSLRNNDDVLTLSANGLFSFPTLLGPGNTFNVVVISQPTGQTCLVAAGAGTVTVNFPSIPFVQVICVANTYSIGGTLFGLDPGQSVTLQNGADSLVLSANGGFVFPTRVTHGASYAVTVTAQPVGRACQVTGGAGVALGEVSDVQVVCTPNRYTIGGTVSGLNAGLSVTLSLSGSPEVVNSNGSFTFAGRTIPEGASYAVSVSTQPVGQTCTVRNGSGVATANVTDIEVTCVINSYTIGGTLSGLAAGGSLTLRNNGGDDLLLGANGAFVFAAQVLHGEPYEVTVSSAPADQTCFVSNGSGTATRTVSNIQIDCVTGTPVTIGGTVSGLAAGQSVTLQNNGEGALRLTANGAFVFTAPISEGAAYLVAVRTQPSVQTCTVSNASGVASANVTNVAVNCTANSYPIGGSLFDLGPNRTVTLQNNGGDDLVLGEDGFFEFPTQITFGLPYSVSVSAQPVGQTCEVSNGTGTVAAGGNLFAAVTCFTDGYLIGGTLSGLGAGGSITLQNNGGDDLTLSADGSFFFPVPIILGGPYLVSVSMQPVGQTCTVINGAGNATTFNDVNNVAVTCVSDNYSIGGTLSGLAAGGSVTLQNNGGDDLVLGANGSFTFGLRVLPGAPYAVTVSSAPAGQTCTASNGAGTATGNVSDVLVSCVSSTYSVGGTVTGLAGSGLVLRNNGADDLAVAADGSFTFATALSDLDSYAVTVFVQPTSPNQSCTVSSGNGTVAGSNVTNVRINCVTGNYTIGGTVTGLLGSGLVLQNNGGDNLSISGDGSFTFSTAIEDLSAYAVTVLDQPNTPAQNCSVANGVGVLAGQNVTNVRISCITRSYAVGGAVSGLVGSGLILQNNDGDNLPISVDGSFVFSTALEDLNAYAVSVLAQPSTPAQTCSVANGVGSVSGQSVTNVSITCVTNTYTIGGTVSGLAGSGLVLRNNGDDDLPISADGSFSFATALNDLSAYAVTVLAQPNTPTQTCSVVNGAGALAGANVTNVQITCSTDRFTIGGTVSGLQGVGLVLRNNGDDDLAIAADGGFSFATALPDLSGYVVSVAAQPTGPIQTCAVANGSGTLAGQSVSHVSVQCVLELPVLTLSQPELDFGTLIAGPQGASLSITLTNTGTGELLISSLTTPEAPFALVGGSCLAAPLQLLPGASCVIEVGFFPNNLPAHYASSFEIASNSSSSPTAIRLRGVVVDPVTVPVDNPFGLILLMLLLVGVGGWQIRAKEAS